MGGPGERRNVAGRTPAPDPSEQARQWVERTCAAQGLPNKLADGGVLSDVAVLLLSGRKAGGSTPSSEA
jgi:hypothetical protein